MTAPTDRRAVSNAWTTTNAPATTRREFLHWAGAAAVLALHRAASAGPQPQQQKDGDVDPHALPIVDTHQHLWDLKRFNLPWLKNEGAAPLRQSYLLSDYRDATRGWNVAKTVYMEVNIDPSQQQAEAEYVLDLCRRPESRMAGAVIGGSPQSEGFRKYIEPLARDPHVKGVRTVLHDADRPRGMCLEPRFVENIQLLGKLGLSFDLCMRPAELADGVKLIEQCPGTRFIIDHCGNMDVQSKDETLWKTWRAGITAAAALPNSVCKISGIIVTANKGAWKPADLAPVVNHCLDSFGPERVFFGGDWPVCTLVDSYSAWAAALFAITTPRGAEYQRKLFHDNATRFYRLEG